MTTPTLAAIDALHDTVVMARILAYAGGFERQGFSLAEGAGGGSAN